MITTNQTFPLQQIYLFGAWKKNLFGHIIISQLSICRVHALVKVSDYSFTITCGVFLFGLSNNMKVLRGQRLTVLFYAVPSRWLNYFSC